MIRRPPTETGFPMHVRLAVVSMLAASLFTGAAEAQQSSSSRLMFDPSSVQDSRRPAQSLQPATTSGQSVAQPAARPVQQQVQQQPVQQQTAPAPRAASAPKPAARTAAPRNQAAAPRATGDAADNTVSRSAERPVPREQPNLGRLSLPQGSLGYEGRTQLNAYDMSDGRRVPGFDNLQRNDSSYFGLSLRMPTINGPAASGGGSSSPAPSSFGIHGAN